MIANLLPLFRGGHVWLLLFLLSACAPTEGLWAGGLKPLSEETEDGDGERAATSSACRRRGEPDASHKPTVALSPPAPSTSARSLSTPVDLNLSADRARFPLRC